MFDASFDLDATLYKKIGERKFQYSVKQEGPA